MLLLDLVGPAAAQPVERPLEEVEEALGRGEDVEGGRDGPALLEVGDPELGAGELPLDVRLLLWEREVRVRCVGSGVKDHLQGAGYKYKENNLVEVWILWFW